MTIVDVLIPTYNRPSALAVTLTSLIAQSFQNFRIVISDQTETFDAIAVGEVQSALRVLRSHQHSIATHRHLPRRGMAEQRQFLLDQVTAPYALFLDDDLILESYVIEQMLTAIQQECCGFVGSALTGLSFVDDIRPHEQAIEFWDEPVHPEALQPGMPEWERWRLHNAANLFHLQQRLNLDPKNPRKYRVAWVGGCVIYDTQKLRSVGGFNFWQDLPLNHCGEDVMAQQRVMSQYGGCGLIPSGVYHQELPTTIVDRSVNAPIVLRTKTTTNKK
ncbi:glycosyltransferase family 2 protein [Phormidesmis sp. 146-35]